MHQQSDPHPLTVDLETRPRIPRTRMAQRDTTPSALHKAAAGVLVLMLAACGPGGPPVNDETADSVPGLLGIGETAVNPNAPGVANRTPTGNRASTGTTTAATTTAATTTAATTTAATTTTAASTTGVAPATTGMTTTAAPVATGGTINTVETIVADMRLMNDAVLRGYENRTVGWYVGPGIVQLGTDPRMTNAPDWFRQSYPSYINGTYMRALLPWVVIFDGVDNRATNTRIHIRNMRAWYLSRSTGQWRSLGLSPGVSGYNTGKTTLVGGNIAENKRSNADGSVEIKPPTDTSLAWHGWWNNGRIPIEPTDIQALLVTLQARLTVDNPGLADDRTRSQYMVQMGADYYYDQNWNWTIGAPGVGTSRSKLVKNDWQAFNLFTFTDVGISEPGGGITEAAFRRNPPPLE
jgi:hypothetical protein